MAERKNTYTNMTDRRAAIKLAESEGWVLENDNHLDNGTKELIFTDSPERCSTDSYTSRNGRLNALNIKR